MELKHVRRLSYAAGFVHLLLCCGLVVLGATSVWNRDNSPPFFSTPHLHAAFGLLVAFTALTAFFHLVVYPRVYARTASSVQDGKNPARFLEYALTASAMLVVIAILSGVQNVAWLAALALASALTMLIGYAVEAQKVECSVFASCAAWFLLFAAYASIFYRFNEVAQVHPPPDFVYAIVVTMFLLFCCFGGVQALWLWRGREKSVRYEGAYLVLSLVAKTLLVVLTASGVPPMLAP